MGFWQKKISYTAVSNSPYTDWEYRRVRMPRVSNQLLECSVYLYRTEDDARSGRSAGGSGFLLGVPLGAAEPITPPRTITQRTSELHPFPVDPWDDGDPFLYVVTNWHNIEGGHQVVRFNAADGKHEVLRLSHWISHPSADLAIHLVPWRYVEDEINRCVPYEIILAEEEMYRLDIGIGDDTVSIGRFVNHEGKQNNRPVARFGHIAMVPAEDEPISVVYELEEGRRKVTRPQVSLLVESRTIPGYSGSPVFLMVPPWELREAPNETTRQALYNNLSIGGNPYILMRLLGITWGYLLGRNEKGWKVGRRAISAATHPSNSGMMGAVPSWKLLELLNQPELVQQREEIRKDRAEDTPQGVGC